MSCCSIGTGKFRADSEQIGDKGGCYPVGMDILLSHTTALEALRIGAARRPPYPGRPTSQEVPERVPLESELLPLVSSSELLGTLSRPLHLLSSRTRGSRRTGLVYEHRQGDELPSGSIIELEPGVRCVSPEQLVVEMSFSLTLLELTVLLGELLGLYAVFPWDERGMRQRDEPLMTPEGLLAHLDALGPRKGTSRVRRALSLACVRSGSPRETKLSLRLSLKPSLGGYGLSVLSMNEPVEVGRIHDRLQRGTRRPDILVAGPERPGQERRVAAVEYNGRDHDVPARISEDARRTNELVAVGIPEFVVRREQYADLDYMDGLVERIREKLGVPRPMQSAERRARLRALRWGLYLELERIDGVSWNGRERERAAAREEVDEWDVVPVDAYGLC